MNTITTLTEAEKDEINQMARALNQRLLSRAAQIIAPFAVYLTSMHLRSATFTLDSDLQITVLSGYDSERAKVGIVDATLGIYGREDIDLIYNTDTASCDTDLATGALLDRLSRWLPAFESWQAKAFAEIEEDDPFR